MRPYHAGLILLLLGTFLTSSQGGVPFKTGEKLTYHFYFGPFMVGRGTFEVLEEKPSGIFTLQVRVKSNDFISALYPVEDFFTSNYNSIKGQSIQFMQDRREGTSRVWEEFFFFPSLAHGQMTSYKTGELKWFEIPKEGVLDKLSTIYHMRNLDWSKRQEAEALLASDKKNYKVQMTKTSVEILETDDFKPISAFVVEPNTEYLGGFVSKGKMNVWVSNDSFKIPIKVVARLPVGTIRSVLVKAEGIPGWPYDKSAD